MLSRESSQKRLLEFFGRGSDSAEECDFSSLRLPAGTFCRQAFSDLNDLELVEFDTRTGIACQGPDEWDVVPTIQGWQKLQNAKS